jgi:hypothetical protein
MSLALLRHLVSTQEKKKGDVTSPIYGDRQELVGKRSSVAGINIVAASLRFAVLSLPICAAMK